MRTRDDNRGVTPVIGFILVFAFIVASLGLFQTFIVPDQNAELEQNHAAQIDDDFARLHSGVLNAVEANENYTATVRMGVQYPARALALNPANPQGSVRTEEVGTLSADNKFDTNGDATVDPFYTVCDKNTNPTTKRLVYEPNYQYVNGYGNHTFENAITSQNVDDRFAEYKQALVSGDTIHLRPIIAGSIDQTASGSASVELRTGKTGVADYNPSTDWTLTLPTKLSQEQWETLVDDNPSIVSASVTASSDSVDVTFKDKADGYTIKCTPIGVNEDPNNQPNFAQPTAPGSEGGNSVNPPGPIILTESTTSGEIPGSGNSINCKDTASNCIVKLRLSHTDSTGDDWEIRRLRYHFYTSPAAPGSGSANAPPSSVDVYEEESLAPLNCKTGSYDFQADYTDATMFGEIQAGGTKTFYLDFRKGTTSTYESVQGDAAIITIKIQNENNADDVRYLTYFASFTHDDTVDTDCITAP